MGRPAFGCFSRIRVLRRGDAVRPAREFVAQGPYKYVRNPMYVGGLGVLAGFGLYQRSLAIVLFALVFLCCAHLFVVFYEEPGLERRFGQSYLDYKRSVNRWLPRG